MMKLNLLQIIRNNFIKRSKNYVVTICSLYQFFKLISFSSFPCSLSSLVIGSSSNILFEPGDRFNYCLYFRMRQSYQVYADGKKD